MSNILDDKKESPHLLMLSTVQFYCPQLCDAYPSSIDKNSPDVFEHAPFNY